jgi:sugar lactone lactonase YvrE
VLGYNPHFFKPAIITIPINNNLRRIYMSKKNALRKCFLLSMALLFILNTFVVFAEPVNKVNFKKIWELKNTPALNCPESVAVDSKRNCIWVVNHLGDESTESFISKLSMDGKVLNEKFCCGLTGLRGIKLIGDSIFVSECKTLTEISADTGLVIKQYTAADTSKLNDITVDAAGNIYVSDCYSSTTGIFKVEGDKLVSWLNGKENTWQNGIAADGDNMYCAPWGISDAAWYPIKPVAVKVVNMKTKVIKDLTTLSSDAKSSSLDGCEIFDEKNILVSNWWDGKIYLVNKTTGTSVLVLDLKHNGTCDIYYDQATKMLYVPLGTGYSGKGESSLIAYKLN